MPEDKTNSPFYLEAGIDIFQLKEALTSAEKFYMSFSTVMGKVITGLEDQEKQQEKTGDSAKKAAKEEEESTEKATKAQKERFRVTKKVGEGVRKVLKQEKEAAVSLGISWQSLAGLIGGVTVIGLIGKAMKDYIEFDRQVRSINAAFSAQPKLMSAASGAVQGLTGYLNLSRDELAQVVKQVGELHLIRENTRGGAKAFRALTKDIIHAGKALDVSMDSVAGLFDTFTRVYGLPHHRLRNIAASMKYIQETTSISGQELISFAESLEDVVSRMTKTTEEGQTKATVDLMAMAGVLKKMGVQPQKVSQMFGEAMKVHSEQGAQFLSFLTQGTDVQAIQLRKMIQQGDVQTPLTLLIQRLKKETPEWMELHEEWLTETTGLTFAELRNIQRSSTDSLEDIFSRSRKEYIRGQKHAEEAQKRQHRLAALWNRLKRVAENVWLKIGGMFVNVATKVSKFLVPAIESMAKKFGDWVSSPSGAKAIDNWGTGLVGLLKTLSNWLSKKIPGALRAMGKFWDKNIKEKFEWLMSEEGGKAVKGWFQDVLSTLGSAAKGFQSISVAIKDVREALKTDEEQAWDWMQAKYEMLDKDREDYERYMAKQIKRGGEFEFRGHKMKATEENTKAFMAYIAQQQLADFVTGLGKYDVSPELKASMHKTFGARLKQGIAETPTAVRNWMLAEGPVPTFASMKKGKMSPPEARIPPTTVETPGVEVKVEKQSPLKVNVTQRSQESEKLLLEIRDVLNRIATKDSRHPSRQLLAEG